MTTTEQGITANGMEITETTRTSPQEVVQMIGKNNFQGNKLASMSTMVSPNPVRQISPTMVASMSSQSDDFVPRYRRFNFDMKSKFTTNGTLIDDGNDWICSKMPSQAPKRKRLDKDKTFLLTDSICKHVAHIWDVDLYAYPGSNIEDFLTRIRLNKIPDLNKASNIILHVGTNNLQMETEKEVAQKVFHLARVLYAKYDTVVILSLIIPRLDSNHLNGKAQKVNEILKKGINPSFMHALYTHRVFLKKGRIDPTLYCQLDKIHPSAQGNKMLFKYYTTRVNEFRKAMSIPRGLAPPPPKKVIRKSDKRW